MSPRYDIEESPRNKNGNISYRVIATTATAIIWALTFYFVVSTNSAVQQLKQDMAVVKYRLHIPDSSDKARDYDPDSDSIWGMR